MGVAGGLLLLIVGAVFAFAVPAHIGSLNLQVVGWILLLAGVFSVGLTLWRMDPTKRRRIVYVRRRRGVPASYRRAEAGERIRQRPGREPVADPGITGEPVVEPVMEEEIEERAAGPGEPPVI